MNNNKKRKITLASPTTAAAECFRNVKRLVLSGAAIVSIHEDGRLTALDPANLHCKLFGETLTIGTRQQIDCDENSVRGSIQSGGSVRIGDDVNTIHCSGGIASVTGGVASVINTGRGGGDISVWDGQVSFKNGAIRVSLSGDTLSIEAPQSTALKVNGQTVGTAQHLLAEKDVQEPEQIADVDPIRWYCIDLETSRLESVCMNGSSALQIYAERLFEQVELLEVRASGSTSLGLSKTFTLKIPKLVATLSGSANMAFNDVRFEQVAVNASGCSVVSSLVALRSAQVRASGASIVYISAYAREIVDEQARGAGVVHVKLLDK